MAPLRILIGEDDLDFQKVAKVRLEHEGYEVVTADNGQDALDLLVQTHAPVHLILLDIRMPEMDGYEVCRRLQANPETAKIPVIVMTGVERDQEVLGNRCVEIGVSDWLVKPFPMQDLMVKIHRILGDEEDT